MSKRACDCQLCYVDGPVAYFTELQLSDQWGDDWNDAPYEHNSEEPYTGHYVGTQRIEHRVIKVYWSGPFETPDEHYTNSPYSVEAINRGDVAWLRPSQWSHPPEACPIPAGTTLREFMRLIDIGGGTVYLDVDIWSELLGVVTTIHSLEQDAA